MHRWHIARVLLIIPFIAVLSVPFFDRLKPEWLGFPFYYWWQLVWVVLSVGVIGLVYKMEHPDRGADR